MREYTVYLSQNGGAFGNMRVIWMLNDEHAIEAARRALVNVEAIDIWDNGRRVALLTRARDRQIAQTSHPLHA